MKKILFSLLSATVLLAGCLETTEEATIQADGSGKLSVTNDLSKVIALANGLVSGEEAENMRKLKVDTSIALGNLVDSIPSLTEDDKKIMKSSDMKMEMDFAAEKGIITMNFPFNSPAEIPGLVKLSSKLMSQAMEKQMGGPQSDPMMAMPEASSMDDYFEFSFKNGQFKKKLNKDKYAGVGSDEYLNGMKDAVSNGLPFTTTQVFNLPRAAKKAEGKNIVLSGDRKKVTVTSSLGDFFDNAEDLEFEIEY